MVETRVAQKISQISGVGLVTLSGGQRPAVRVKLNAQAIAALGLTSESVRTAILARTLTQRKGALTALLARSRFPRTTRCNRQKSIVS